MYTLVSKQGSSGSYLRDFERVSAYNFRWPLDAHYKGGGQLQFSGIFLNVVLLQPCQKKTFVCI